MKVLLSLLLLWLFIPNTTQAGPAGSVRAKGTWRPLEDRPEFQMTPKQLKREWQQELRESWQDANDLAARLVMMTAKEVLPDARDVYAEPATFHNEAPADIMLEINPSANVTQVILIQNKDKSWVVTAAGLHSLQMMAERVYLALVPKRLEQAVEIWFLRGDLLFCEIGLPVTALTDSAGVRAVLADPRSMSSNPRTVNLTGLRYSRRGILSPPGFAR